jgi:lantibiotic biosynthesis protein
MQQIEAPAPAACGDLHVALGVHDADAMLASAEMRLAHPAWEWEPVLHGDLAGRAIETAVAIGEALRSLPVTESSLARGAAGRALFAAYLARAVPGAGFERDARDLIAAAGDLLRPGRAIPTLYHGITGVGWVMEHTRDLLPRQPGDPVGAIDDALLEHLASPAPCYGHYGLLEGLVGVGLYALERLPRPAAWDLVRAVVINLAAAAQPDGAWLNPPSQSGHRAPSSVRGGSFSLGVASGVAGAIALLARCAAAGIETRLSRAAAERAWSWLHRHRRVLATGTPAVAALGLENDPARLAWCCGDPGTAAARALAARCLGADDGTAVDDALRAACRLPAASGVIDAGLCHGAAGNAILFARLHNTSSHPVLRDAARVWFARTLAMRRPGTGVGGYIAWSFDAGWVADPSFLTGAAGVGLALLAGATPVEPRWDRLLLASAAELTG